MFDDEGESAAHQGAKGSINASKGLQRRHNASIKLRKDKRDDQIEKKRRQGTGDEYGVDAEPPPLESGGPLDPLAYTQNSSPASIPLVLLPQFVEMAKSNDDRFIFHGTLMIRKLLSVDTNPPITEVAQTGVIPVLISHMGRDDYTQLQFEATWALTNLTSGALEHTNTVLECGAVPYFIRLLSSPSLDCREQATWAIGNLAGEGAKVRDYVLSLGAMEPLLRIVNSPCDKITFTRNTTWALSNLCRGKPQPPLHVVASSIPVFAGLLNHHDDEVVVDAAWALSYISDGPHDRVQAVLDAGVLERIVQLLQSSITPMQIPAIRTIGNVVTGNDLQTQAVINAGALPPMHFLLNHPKRSVRKETCWTLSNITAGNREQIQAVINANLFPHIIVCTQALEFEVKKEAVWAIANATSGGSVEQVNYLLSIGTIQPLCDLLNLYDPKIIAVSLEALENMLQVGDEERCMGNLPSNPVADAIVAAGGLDSIERLQGHNEGEVYQHCATILRCYFPHVTQGINIVPETFQDFDIGGPGSGAPQYFNF